MSRKIERINLIGDYMQKIRSEKPRVIIEKGKYMRIFRNGKVRCPMMRSSETESRTMQMGRFNAPCHNALINSQERHDSVKIG